MKTEELDIFAHTLFWVQGLYRKAMIGSIIE